MNHTALFEEQVALTPKDMSVQVDSIDAVLEEKLQKKLEGKCSRHGFVVSGTLKVLSRSMGAMERARFTGSILFHIQAEADVLNPPDGFVLEGVVIRKNKMGMYVSYSTDKEEAIRVIVPRDLHIGNEAFEAVEIGENVRVEIKKSRFQINDPYILSVGIFMESLGKGTVAAATPAPPVEEVVGEEQPEEGGAEEQQPQAEGGGEAEEEDEEDEEADEEAEEAEEGEEVEEEEAAEEGLDLGAVGIE
jgi:DNA-directed RNA polymerase subunit E'/Rpb7